ncbi:MAG: hypothetical protein JWO05_785 [Gemmatimonadetes bacterium]|nr:hypothetical protein [Gemmatimonadota bacterium]
MSRGFALVLIVGLVSCRSAERISLPDTGLARAADGRVAFVQATPRRLVQTSLEEQEATELWIASADGSNARLLVSGRASDSVERAIASISSPRFSPDGHRLYFLSTAWVTSAAVHAVDLASGRERFVAPANSLEIVPTGPLSGCLLVDQHRYWPNEGGSYDWTWLLSSDGREIALAASDSDGMERRLATWMSGHVPTDAPSVVRALVNGTARDSSGTPTPRSVPQTSPICDASR